jgi:hypothetical protein
MHFDALHEIHYSFIDLNGTKIFGSKPFVVKVIS